MSINVIVVVYLLILFIFHLRCFGIIPHDLLVHKLNYCGSTHAVTSTGFAVSKQVDSSMCVWCFPRLNLVVLSRALRRLVRNNS
jgi:hypothetical protein